MTRLATSSPPTCARAVPLTIVRGTSAVRALEASAIERSNAPMRWKRLRTRSAKPGRSQNVSVRKARPRSLHVVVIAGASGRCAHPQLQLGDQTLVRVGEVEARHLDDAADAVTQGVRVQAEPARG